MYVVCLCLHEDVVVAVETMMDNEVVLGEAIMDDVGACTEVVLGTAENN